MRSIWSGTLAFGLVTLPVKLYAATELKHEVRFRLLNAKTMHPIREVRVDSQTGKEVPWEQIAHGVEYHRGEFVALSDEEVEALPLPTADTIDISGFTPASSVRPIWTNKSYYIGPEKGAAKPYTLLRRALEVTDRVAIGKMVIRTREHLVIVRPEENVLALQSLYYADEIRAPADVPDVSRDVRLHPNEEKMAAKLIDSMTIRFRLDDYRSEYKVALKQLVRAKVKGGAVAAARQPATAKVIDLQEALRRSLEQTRIRGTRTARKGAGLRPSRVGGRTSRAVTTKAAVG